MGVSIDKEYKIRKARSERAAKNPLAHKARNGGATYKKSVKQRAAAKGASREVMVKITGNAKTARGIKNSINYISRDADLKLRDDEGREYEGDKDVVDAYDYMVSPEDRTRLDDDKNPHISHNMMFNTNSSVGVSQEDMLDAVQKAIKEKYPDNRFVMAYHQDTDNPHVHVVMRIPDNAGNRINIRKSDLRDLRAGFAQKLQGKGYDVKATHKHDFALKNKIRDEPDRTRNLYEVVETGRTHYNNDPKNKRQNFIRLKTIKGEKELTIWGTNLPDELLREKVKKGSVIKIKKEGETTVKVPLFKKNGEVAGYKETKRNNWVVENKGVIGIDRKVNFSKVEILNDPQRAIKQGVSIKQFQDSKMSLMKQQNQDKVGVKIGLFKL
ncbi:MobP1 family relaxase [Serratia sp. OS31]|uniref:MobP1 family relaxase n=1 Tax=Serratia sp. OS31 TaxID=2760844 RepID=UPI001602EB7C|nr:MobP1 family relaxase [Serratia sp. OS31]MBB1585119.1 relaxase/mobilization nuclease domain-containing protein [Serratia sp. OS31]